MVTHDERRSEEPLGRKRARVLALLQDAGAPLTAHDVAERLGIHPNTARFHLDALETDGLVVRTAEPRTSPGRPRALFAAASNSPVVAQRSYQLLAEMLTSFVSDQLPEPATASQAAGMAWGRFLAGPTPPFQRVGEEEAIDALVQRLGRVGFESHTEDDGEDLRLEITHCPFLEVADSHRDVVCSMHLGLMKGLLEQMRAPVSAETLSPLVEPRRCIAHLRRGAAVS